MNTFRIKPQAIALVILSLASAVAAHSFDAEQLADEKSELNGITTASPRGKTLHVANNGVDNARCGGRQDPCRSISRAVQNARDGDTVVVGPGIYGDVNRDGDFSDPGDEAAGFLEEPSCGCVVHVDKPVRVLSSHGADATRIESLPFGPTSLVAISVNGVTFGTPSHGFTLAGRDLIFHLVVTLPLSAQPGSDIGVGGNVALGTRSIPRARLTSETGFAIGSRGATVRLTENAAIGNQFGFSVSGDAPVVLRNNAALENSWLGFFVSASAPHRLVGNFASGNGAALHFENFEPGEPRPTGAGFHLQGANILLLHNLASGNFGPGFLISSSAYVDGGHSFRHNAATGNEGAGFFIAAGVESPMQVQFNNIFGNLGNDAAGEFDTGCGFVNEAGLRINATHNFWGLPSGPGEDPADLAGPNSGCDVSGSLTIVTPFAQHPLQVNP